MPKIPEITGSHHLCARSPVQDQKETSVPKSVASGRAFGIGMSAKSNIPPLWRPLVNKGAAQRSFFFLLGFFWGGGCTSFLNPTHDHWKLLHSTWMQMAIRDMTFWQSLENFQYSMWITSLKWDWKEVCYWRNSFPTADGLEGSQANWTIRVFPRVLCKKLKEHSLCIIMDAFNSIKSLS